MPNSAMDWAEQCIEKQPGRQAGKDSGGHITLPGTGVRKGEIMKGLINRTKNFLKSEDGPTATEYAVMLALIIVACLAAITTLSDKVQTTFENVASQLPDGTTS